MAVRRRRPASRVLARETGSLIGLFFDENGNEAVRYFSSEEAADEAVRALTATKAADLAGAWSDLDWDEMARKLDLIRHESTPSAPLSL